MMIVGHVGAQQLRDTRGRKNVTKLHNVNYGPDGIVRHAVESRATGKPLGNADLIGVSRGTWMCRHFRPRKRLKMKASKNHAFCSPCAEKARMVLFSASLGVQSSSLRSCAALFDDSRPGAMSRTVRAPCSPLRWSR